MWPVFGPPRYRYQRTTDQPQAPRREDFVTLLCEAILSPMHSSLPSLRPLSHQTIAEATLAFQRSRDRLVITCPIMFAGVPFIGEGVIHNLSHAGCRAECDRTVQKGSYVTVRLLLPDHTTALIVELAAIRWVREGCFGIEFLRLPAFDQNRIDEFLIDYHRL